jgi:uncharacterized protein (TIGR02246 family)
MNTGILMPKAIRSVEEVAICAVYRKLLDGWNRRSGHAMAAPFAEEGEAIGFDGSQHVGKSRIAAEIEQIFTRHAATPVYVANIQKVRILTSNVAVLHAKVGMIPPGSSEINPQLNAHQTVTVVKREDIWQIEFFQNTPAQFHGRPDLVEAFTEELRLSLLN